ncbi:hypothetical protein D9613_002296 [Agrocybe pediades]|uniref:Uncharacterized protein n=1 Tax=Agrocybe pediades TaxID=84607 RepID=A0A8H4R685_9AGAR|nr:hypothetical protein D9613_002296 [Agrocybe pediades]
MLRSDNFLFCLDYVPGYSGRDSGPPPWYSHLYISSPSSMGLRVLDSVYHFRYAALRIRAIPGIPNIRFVARSFTRYIVALAQRICLLITALSSLSLAYLSGTLVWVKLSNAYILIPGAFIITLCNVLSNRMILNIRDTASKQSHVGTNPSSSTFIELSVFPLTPRENWIENHHGRMF